MTEKKADEKTGERLRISRKWIRGFTELYTLLYFKAHPNSSGYDFSKFVKSEYGFRISYSKIYPLLDKLKEAGVLLMKDDTRDYPPKKVYRLTPKGIRLIEEYKGVFLSFMEDFQ